jgi:thiol:disulfide interchange protein
MMRHQSIDSLSRMPARRAIRKSSQMTAAAAMYGAGTRAATMPELPACRGSSAPSTAWHVAPAAAAADARSRGVPVFAAFVGSDWCQHCIRVEAEVLRTPAFARWASGRVALLWVDFPHKCQRSDAEQAAADRLKDRLGVLGLPTFVFLDAATLRPLGTAAARPGGLAEGETADDWIARAEAVAASL